MTGLARLIRLTVMGLLAALAFAFATELAGQTLTARARVDPAQSEVRDMGGGIAVTLHLSQGVPFRAYTLNDPARLVLDLREADWTGVSRAGLLNADNATDARFGPVRPGLSRLVVELAGPMAVELAGLSIDPETAQAQLDVEMVPTTAEEFAARAGAPDVEGWDTLRPEVRPQPKQRQTGDRPVVVVLDPGHGGLDPGAEVGSIDEADLMLTFALELEEALTRAGGFTVVLTRRDDIFVPLDTRIQRAHSVQADAFISLHADAVIEGNARGATVYTLSDQASDTAAQRLAERHARSDLLSGVDLTRQDDEIATVLMEMAQIETAPRSQRLAASIVEGLKAELGTINSTPRRSGGFLVLKAADIPSVLLELGFMSDAQDLENIQSPDWRARAVSGIVSALQVWARDDAAEAALLRQ